MKKLIPLLVISTLILTGCGAKSNQVIQPQQQVQQDEIDDEEQSDAEWFADEVLDVDDWGKKKKKKKVVPKTEVKKPSTNTKSSTPKSSTNTKSSTTKKK